MDILLKNSNVMVIITIVAYFEIWHPGMQLRWNELKI